MPIRHSPSQPHFPSRLDYDDPTRPALPSPLSDMSFEKQRLNITRTDSLQKNYAATSSSFSLAPLPFQLTSHERIMLARQNLGYTQAIVHAVRYPLTQLPSREFLEVRVSELQFRLPRLNACVANARTNRPTYESGAPWAAKEIVQDGLFTSDANASADSEFAHILHMEEERFAEQDFDHSPMWSVSILTSPEKEYGYLVACFNHLIVDGRGSLRLVHLLTARGINLPVESFDFPKRMDDTIDLKPDARFLAPIVFREIIVPKLPKGLQKKFKAKDPWPAERVGSHPAAAPSAVSFVSVSTEIVDLCKNAGKSHGVKTFHPLLKMAYMAAMWRVFGPGANGAGNSLKLVCLTTRDERRSRLGHSSVTGSYCTSPEYTTKVAGEQKFWSATRHMASWLLERGVAVGRYNHGVLYHIPDPEVSELKMDPNYDPALPTGWEQYYSQRACAPAPFRNSLAMHNLGMARLPQGAEDHAFSQTANPYAPVWNINVLTHEGGLRLSSVYRDGCATTRAQTDALLVILQRVLERIAFGEADCTIAELTS